MTKVIAVSSSQSVRYDPAPNLGLQFGRLTIVGVGRVVTDVNGKKSRQYECSCACGEVTHAHIRCLRSGSKKSCGCLKMSADGLGDTPEYKVWKEMHRRCSDKSHARYSEWGGRGISVCDRWSSFNNFLNDMGGRPGKGYSIERKRNSEGYSSGNCHWADTTEQNNNKRNNRMMSFNGKSQSMSLWCKELGLNYNTVRSRVYLRNWSDERALSTPTRVGACK